ncbi:hypothetical protein L2E82_49559 [Cichorium intybus]|uniref:Uncharacterized protein n=1 Tax=Cichorium intybus TaxID=13427 RepID=A0ACB8Z0G6_CICIN|nr:hypothetical protein L2E82_49559 [Cichorium intybus]
MASTLYEFLNVVYCLRTIHLCKYFIIHITQKTHPLLVVTTTHTHTVIFNILSCSPLKRKSHHSLLQQHKRFCFMTVRIFYRFGQHQPEKKQTLLLHCKTPSYKIEVS